MQEQTKFVGKLTIVTSRSEVETYLDSGDGRPRDRSVSFIKRGVAYIEGVV